MLTTLTITFAVTAYAWTTAWFRIHGGPSLQLRTIPAPAIQLERDLLPAPLAR